VIVEQRTNSLIVTETSSKLAEIRDLIDRVDIPIRQVMIESRIVIAQSDLEEELGIRWGGGYLNPDANGNILSISGDSPMPWQPEQLGDQRHPADPPSPGL
jgi:type IV pilus assembly protein PilQ